MNVHVKSFDEYIRLKDHNEYLVEIKIIHHIRKSWWILVLIQSLDVPPDKTHRILNYSQNQKGCSKS